jgi:hypothetical protein
MSGARCGPRGRQACRTRASRGSTRGTLRSSRQELADGGANAPESVARVRKAPQQSAERRASRIATGGGTLTLSVPGVASPAAPGGRSQGPRVSRRSAPLNSGAEECAQPGRSRRGINQARP